ncbi:DUF222 domain-containing protein, partial [Trebonia sp.]|uniref:DUF222 domain-containing protein n=1 Tax=Trebonia sp. TaxID=2767075 RepID=UPI003CC63BDC
PEAAGGQRDPRLAGFAEGGAGDTCPPGAGLAAVVDELSGPEWRCAGATDEELIGLLGRWDALGSWAEAGKLGVVRELLRRRARPGLGGAAPSHGDLPDQWEEGAGHEVSGALAISLRSADNLTAVAWDLRARLPGIGAALADGTLSPVKARIISDELKVLDDEHAAQAEKLILDLLDGQTPAQLGRLAAHAVVTVDPDGAAKRRQHAEREEARVRFWRDNGGACALAAFGLPTDAALAANDAINDRAAAYKAAKLRPDARMDQLRVLAFLDILNGITLQARIAADRAAQAEQASASGDGDSTSQSAPGGPGSTRPNGASGGGVSTSDGAGADNTTDIDSDGISGGPDAGPRGTYPDDDGKARTGGEDHGTSRGDVSTSDGAGAGSANGRNGDGTTSDAGGAGSTSDRAGDSSTSDRHQGGNGNDRGGSSCDGDGSTTGGSPGDPASAPILPALTARSNLTFPLATLLGLAERPGAAHGLGPLDPALVRDLAAAAASSPHSQWCITITDSQGVAVAHGCAKRARTKKNRPGPPPASRDGPIPWAFTATGDPGPPGGYGTWTLTLPGGREFTVQLEPIPVTDCDHRHESRGHQPSDTLRHLVQVRDGTCTFPPCSRHARESDFEHAVPYDKGGRTCACNGGARSRRCHRVKQSKGWTVTQPQPGWHQWTTPAGRTYTQGPMQYPALYRPHSSL